MPHSARSSASAVDEVYTANGGLLVLPGLNMISIFIFIFHSNSVVHGGLAMFEEGPIVELKGLYAHGTVSQCSTLT